MSDELGRLSWLPTPEVQADPDGFFSEVLTGWKRQQLANNFGVKTVQRRTATVLRMASFVGSFPWEWLPGDADDFSPTSAGSRTWRMGLSAPIRAM